MRKAAKMTYYCPECRASTAFREGTIQHYDNCRTSEAKLQRRLAAAQGEKDDAIKQAQSAQAIISLRASDKFFAMIKGVLCARCLKAVDKAIRENAEQKGGKDE